jgi:hypothetical protein
MAMEHKAFAFDYEAFEQELAPLLREALQTGATGELVAFIEANRDTLTDPYEGEPLGADWQTMVDPPDAHQYGDFALTKFYDPQDDLGLGADWEAVQALLQAEVPGGAAFVLGRPFGPPGSYFDPGKMGAYFQSAREVQEHRRQIQALVERKPELSSQIEVAIAMFDQLAAGGHGAYVTF